MVDAIGLFNDYSLLPYACRAALNLADETKPLQVPGQEECHRHAAVRRLYLPAGDVRFPGVSPAVHRPQVSPGPA